MAGKFSTHIKFGGGYLFDEEALVRIAKILEDVFGHRPLISAEFKNNRKIETREIGDVLSDTMARAVSLRELDYFARNEQGSALVSLSAKLFKEPISLLVEGERTTVLDIEDKLLNEFSANKRWWGIFRGNDAYSSWARQLIYALWIIAGIVNALISFKSPPHWLTVVIHVSYVVLTLIVALYAAIALIFPKMQFSFGRGEKISRNRQGIFNFIFGAVVLTTILSIFAGWLSKMLNLF